MLKKTNLLGLLSMAAVLGLVSFPAQAKPLTSSNTTQDSYINGNNNRVQQRSHQVIIQVDTPDINVNPAGGSASNSSRETLGHGRGNSARSNRYTNPGRQVQP